MKTEQIKKEINSWGLSEKLLLVEDIWDSIAFSNSVIPMPMRQKQELDKRYDEYKKDKLELRDWEDVHRELRQKYK
ncbi:MAG: addiction module protein [Deltaproteobacteria bacterium]|jgi:putative addiction module component (TIGR02574 family)|nr:addiction module protein [Deltaproteobacteria bacterium]